MTVLIVYLKLCTKAKPRFKLNPSIFKNMETQKEMFMCFGVLTNWVKSMKIKLKRGYLQTETSLASTACMWTEKNRIFLNLVAGCWSQTCLSLKVSTFQFYFHRFNLTCQNTETHKHLFLCFRVFKDRLVQL